MSGTSVGEEDLNANDNPNANEDETNLSESIDPLDRSRVIPWEVSERYLESEAYDNIYGQSKVWELYRRNFAMGRTNRPTRKQCVRNGKISTGNPCPICR